MSINSVPDFNSFNFPTQPSIAQKAQQPTLDLGHIIFGKNWDTVTNPFYILLFFIALLIFFLIVREFICWYWKINKRVRLLEDINSKLTLLVGDKEPRNKDAESISGPEQTEVKNNS